MQKALQTRRQRLRRLRALRGGTAGKAAASGFAIALVLGVVMLSAVAAVGVTVY